MASQAQIQANIRYNRSRDSITIRPSKEDGAAVRQAAAAAGQSVQGYIMQACSERMQRENHDKPEKHLTKSHLHAKMCIMSEEREGASSREALHSLYSFNVSTHKIRFLASRFRPGRFFCCYLR